MGNKAGTYRVIQLYSFIFAGVFMLYITREGPNNK